MARKEHAKVTFTREYCKRRGIRYRIVGWDCALLLFDPSHRKFRQVCYSLLNLSEDGIAEMIYKEAHYNNRKVVYNIADDIYLTEELRRQKPTLTDREIADILDDVRPFRATLILYGRGKNVDRYELRKGKNNHKANINDLNGYQRGVIVNDCYAHFEGRDYFIKGSPMPSGVITITEEVVS